MTSAVLDEATDAARRELASSGTLRVALNVANTALATQIDSGDAEGIAATVAAEIAARLGCAVDYRWHDGVPSIMHAAEEGGWDIAFIAADSSRENRLHFSRPVAELRATMLAARDVPGDAVDQPGRTIASLRGAGYDLALRRTIRHAAIVAFDTQEGAFEAFTEGQVDAVAGLRALLQRAAAVGGGVLKSDFACIEQAVAVRRERPAAAAFVDDVVLSLGLPQR